MEKFINDNFMLQSDEAQELYHESAKSLPIIDYHCHLVPQMIAENHQFANLSDAWLGGDHYKWRAMRGNGVAEEYITGGKSDYEKFEKWAETLQYAMRNPLYHWTHLELARAFDVDKVLNPSTAKEIYEECTAKLQSGDLNAQQIMRKFNVEVVCTTDDPIDSLEYHKQIAENPFGCKVLPTWRPDKVLAVDKGLEYAEYISKLSEVAGIKITSYETLLDALENRHDYFAEAGCKLSDHGLTTFCAEDCTTAEANEIFTRAMGGGKLSSADTLKFQSAIMLELCRMNHKKDWAQQLHIGAIRNNNTKMFNSIGADTGFDAIHDVSCAASGHKFLDSLAVSDQLAKTILYNLNPKDNDVLAVMAYTFNDGSYPGKMQFGAGWWFLDQEKGMINQMNSLSAMGLLSRFVGMLTDSRSFLSYPRHEYFRRILCNLIGDEVKNGKLPKSEMPFIHQMVKDISYYNAKNYFKF